MTLLLLALIAVAIGLRFRLRHRASRALYIISALLALGVGCGPLADLMIQDLQKGNGTTHQAPWGTKNVILVLGAGTESLPNSGSIEPSPFAYGRLFKSRELYFDCKQYSASCILLVSGGDAQAHKATEAAVYSAALVRLGIPPADVMLEERSLNTWENAKYSAGLLKTLGADHTVLVTSAIHVRRSGLYLAHFGLYPVVVPSDHLNAKQSFVPLAYNFTLADLAMHEYTGVLRYYVYTALGWNKPER